VLHTLCLLFLVSAVFFDGLKAYTGLYTWESLFSMNVTVRGTIV
jgi:hypothetical protein